MYFRHLFKGFLLFLTHLLFVHVSIVNKVKTECSVGHVFISLDGCFHALFWLRRLKKLSSPWSPTACEPLRCGTRRSKALWVRPLVKFSRGGAPQQNCKTPLNPAARGLNEKRSKVTPHAWLCARCRNADHHRLHHHPAPILQVTHGGFLLHS